MRILWYAAIITSCCALFAQFTTAHSGKIKTIISNDTITVTTGVDGIVKITDDKFRSARELYVSANALGDVAFHPTDPLIAIETLGTSQQQVIVVYNTQSNTKLYEFKAQDAETISYFSFSPQGRYLVIAGNVGGIQRLQARSGIPIKEYKSPLFADYFFIGKSTKNILTYTADTGILAYYNFRNGSQVQTFQSQKGLQSLTALSTRYLLGIREDRTLHLLDLSNGISTELYRSSQKIQAFSIDLQNNTVYMIEQRNNAPMLTVLSLSNTRQPRSSVIPFDPTAIHIDAKQIIYIAESTGKIHQVDPVSHRFSLLLDHHHIPIERFSFSQNNELTALCKNNLISVRFRLEDNTIRPMQLRYTTASPNDIYFSPDTAYSSALSSYPDFFTLPSLPIDAAVQTIEQLAVYSDFFLYRTQSDDIILQDRQKNEARVQLSVPGVNDVTYIPDKTLIIIAQPAIGMFNTSLLAIHSVTQETIPLKSNQFLTFDVHYSEKNNLLYSLGLERSEDNTIHTSVEIHDGNALQFYWKGVEVDEEHLGAFLVEIDDVVTVAGIENAKTTWFDETTISPELSTKLRYYSSARASQDLISVLRKDGSITVMDKGHSEQLITLYCNSKASRWELWSQQTRWHYPFGR